MHGKGIGRLTMDHGGAKCPTNSNRVEEGDAWTHIKGNGLPIHSSHPKSFGHGSKECIPSVHRHICDLLFVFTFPYHVNGNFLLIDKTKNT